MRISNEYIRRKISITKATEPHSNLERTVRDRMTVNDVVPYVPYTCSIGYSTIIEASVVRDARKFLTNNGMFAKNLKILLLVSITCAFILPENIHLLNYPLEKRFERKNNLVS